MAGKYNMNLEHLVVPESVKPCQRGTGINLEEFPMARAGTMRNNINNLVLDYNTSYKINICAGGGMGEGWTGSLELVDANYYM